MKLLYVCFFVMTACSVRDLNLPQPSPMPVVKPTCPVKFKDEMKPAEIAVAAYEMQQLCGFSSDQILALTENY